MDNVDLRSGFTDGKDLRSRSCIYHLKKIQELKKDKILFNVFNLNKKTINPLLINHNDPEGCYILYWDNHYFLCKDVSFLLRKSS